MTHDTQAPDQEQPAKRGRGATKPVRDHAIIRLHAKRNEHDLEDVPVQVNGARPSIFQREELVPVTRGELSVLHDAKYPNYKVVPGEERQVVGSIHRYPFDTIAKITEAQYHELKRLLAKKGKLTEADVEAVVDG